MAGLCVSLYHALLDELECPPARVPVTVDKPTSLPGSVPEAKGTAVA